MLFIGLFIQCISSLYFTNKNAPEKFTLKAGKYIFLCKGANGGSVLPHYGGSYPGSSGGSGSFINATLSITGQPKVFYAFVGGEGIPNNKNKGNENGENPGGWNGGGSSGKGFQAGSGGGATDIRYNSVDINARVMVAAGGSGASLVFSGLPGGTMNGYSFDANTKNYYDSTKTTQTLGGPNGQGENGISCNGYPSSGGGGGWMGGVSTKCRICINCAQNYLSDSGSSYVSGYNGMKKHDEIVFNDIKMQDGREHKGYGSGYIEIITLYECPDNCVKCSENQGSEIGKCEECSFGYLPYLNKCVLNCPQGSIKINNRCEVCKTPCSACTSTQTKCTSCITGYYLYQNQCLKTCPSGYISLNGRCVACNYPCSKCSTTQKSCTECINGYFLYQNQCLNACPSGYIVINKKCIACNYPCSKCTATQKTCTACISGYYLYNNQCLTVCPKGYIGINGKCEICNYPCSECTITQNTCKSCIDGYYLYENKCIESCPINYFANGSDCQKCDKHCTSCHNSFYNCTQCEKGYKLYLNKCYEKCPSGTRMKEEQCEDCFDINCKICDDLSTKCDSCENDYKLYLNKCYKTCPFGTIESSDKCIKCEFPCLDCITSSDQCLTCQNGYYLFNNKCYSKCSDIINKELNEFYGNDVKDNQCKECLDNNCINCSYNYKFCLECPKSYILISGKCYPTSTENSKISTTNKISFQFSKSEFTEISYVAENSGSKKKNNTLMIIGIINAIIALIILFLVVSLFIFRKKKNIETENENAKCSIKINHETQTSINVSDPNEVDINYWL